LLALVIDHGTAALVSDINYEIGRNAHFESYLKRWPRTSHTEYERLLREYVGLKLQLHQLRKSMYYPFDAYAEREGDFKALLERCKELRRKIREVRESIPTAAWGGIPPEKTPTVWDKPLLYAMEDATCSWDHYSKAGHCGCTAEATKWYQGLPYCEYHIAEVRFAVRNERKAKQHEARARHKMDDVSGVMWDHPKSDPDIVHAPAEGEPCRVAGCVRTTAHAHCNGRVEML
jgi:hypothetical protein